MNGRKLRKNSNKAAYEEGREAGRAGHHRDINPFRGTTLFVHWAEGHETGWQERRIRLVREGLE